MLINLALGCMGGVGFAAGVCWHWTLRRDLQLALGRQRVETDRFRQAYRLADERCRELVSSNRELSTQLAVAVAHPSIRVPESAEVIAFRRRGAR